MLQSFHLGFQFLSCPSITCKVEGSHLGLKNQQLKFQHFYSKTKSPTWDKHPPQLSDPPFIAGQHMLLPPTSAPPISPHCLAERPALHSARRARPMQPCPATASRGRSWRQPALSTGSSCSARCSPPNQRYNWIANKLSNKSFPKIYTPKGKIRRASTNSNRRVIHGQLSLYTSWCVSPDWNLWNAHNSSEGRNPQNF